MVDKREVYPRMETERVVSFGRGRGRLPPTLSKANEPSFDEFIGIPQGFPYQDRPWLLDQPVVVQRLQKMTNTDSSDMTRFEDLPQPQPAPVGSVVGGVIIRNDEDIYDPSEFYMVLEDTDYSFKNPEWTKYFPPIESTAAEAHSNLTSLYNTYQKTCLEDKPEPVTSAQSEIMPKFLLEQLVFAKFERNADQSSEGNHHEKMRRGVVKNVTLDNGKFSYSVYLLDFGFKLEFPEKALWPLPKPFNCIAPLATKCSLYGISPFYGEWDSKAKQVFSNLLLDHAKFHFPVNILSTSALSSTMDTLAVSVSMTHSRFPDRHVNATQYLIDHQMGIPWNLFPRRPRLMDAGGTKPPENTYRLFNRYKIPQPSVSFQDALIMTPCYLPSVNNTDPLPLSVVRQDISKLLVINKDSLVAAYLKDCEIFISDKAQGYGELMSDSDNTPSDGDMTIDPAYTRTMEQLEEDAVKREDEDKKRRRLFNERVVPKLVTKLSRYPQEYSDETMSSVGVMSNGSIDQQPQN